MTAHSLQCYITKFSSTPTLWNYIFGSKYVFGYANLHMINISSLDFCIWQHLEKHQNESQLQHLASIPSVPVGQLYSHMATGIQHINTFFTWGVNRRYSFNLDTVLTYRSLCNGYRITYTSRIGNILLLFLLVSTCQISVLTFTTKYYAKYNCGMMT